MDTYKRSKIRFYAVLSAKIALKVEKGAKEFRISIAR